MTTRLLRRQTSAATFAGGNQTVGDLYELAQDMVSSTDSTPTAGGTLTVNSQSLGSYDYVVKSGNQTVSSFTVGDWFTSTEDSRSAWVVVDGDLTINSGQTFIPSVRKLFTVVYVTGDLAVNGEISMTGRGANHSSATGSNVSAVAIRIKTGTYSSVTNPQVPAAGGSGGTGPTRTSFGFTGGGTGSAGSAGGTGGGGGGGNFWVAGSGAAKAGDGSAGTCFSGGTGGGCSKGTDAEDGAVDGGKGGDAASTGGGYVGSGSGNPAGSEAGGAGSFTNYDGTGGVLVVFVDGAVSGTGSITANGVHGGDGEDCGGGATGGGSVTVLCASGSVTTTAAGGTGGVRLADNPDTRYGGNGGAGTARTLTWT